MKLKEIVSYLNDSIPLAFQEDYDNSGLQAGDPDSEVTGILISLDPTEGVIREAIETGANLVVTHHPLFFRPLKQITPSTATGRAALLALRNDVAIYSAHTSLDSMAGGVSYKLASVLDLKGIKPLQPLKHRLLKIVTFVPSTHSKALKSAIFGAGAGVIGNYDCCSFSVIGKGSFRGGEETNPFAGQKGIINDEEEVRIETILPAYLTSKVISALIATHPYEEPAYDIYPLENAHPAAGTGAIGNLTEAMSEKDFLDYLRLKTGCGTLRHSILSGRNIKKVALCGGAGNDFIRTAIVSGADTYITGDLRYHDFTEYGSQILLADAGHFETEKYSVQLLYDLIIKKFPTFAVRFSENNTNPINYL